MKFQFKNMFLKCNLTIKLNFYKPFKASILYIELCEKISKIKLLKCIRLSVIYRRPSSKSNDLRTSIFLDQWDSSLDQIVTFPNETIIIEDFNFHIDDEKSPNTVKVFTNIKRS